MLSDVIPLSIYLYLLELILMICEGGENASPYFDCVSLVIIKLIQGFLKIFSLKLANVPENLTF